MKRTIIRTALLSLTLLFLSSCGSGVGGRNHAPVITSRPVTNAVADSFYAYPVQTVDADGDAFLLRYHLKAAPAGMTIDPATGKISWRPNSHQVGNNLVTVSVNDGHASAEQVFAVRVIPDDNGVPFQRGMTLVAWWHDSYLQPQSDESLRNIRADGAEYVSIVVYGFQDTTTSTTIYASADMTATDDALIHAISTAKSLGFRVTLKPDIIVMTGEWRGEISFSNDADWAAWFDSYNQWVGHYLDLAEQNGVDVVIVGTELKGSEGREADWRNTIALARTRFSGLLTYCANHDSYWGVTWWDAVDFIGISAYFRLTSSTSPTVDEIKAAWAPNKTMIRTISAIFQRDVVFTEIGYQSRDGANMTPYGVAADVQDLQEQADCYQAVMETFYNEPWFKGMNWWAWTYDPSGDDNGFDIYHKPAETVLRQWYMGHD